ncbi:hypothetical protein PVAG01_07598 [Phlyctema vagabunda]|uniref:Rhodopsin domain-containing protein n=1 Tax=Phlyctema vagabunda TaxID=108571 RepID=A0ABR4PCV5_9HELO
MSLYSPPPPLRAFRDDKSTLLVCWWCTCFAGAIILFRVCGRYIRSEKLFREDWMAFACLIPLFGRIAFVHVILLFGTNNTETTGLTDLDLHRRMIGSRLVLVSRMFYAATLWMLKLTISEFFKRLTIQIWTRSHERMLNFIRYLLAISFLAIFIADLAECQPVTHYWQVSPDPGPKCRQGYAQLITMGVFNVLTDLLLVLFPIPIIIRSQMPVKRKVQLVLLFAGSLIPAGTTLYRIPNIIHRDGVQQYRSLLASVEILFATAVCNALVLGSFVRDRGVKKQRWKFGSLSDSIERTSSRRGTAVRHWGSDEDLVRGLGLGVNAELRDELSPVARPAPMASAGRDSMPSKVRRLHMGDDWNFPQSDTSGESDSMMMYKIRDGAHSPGDVSSMASPRKVSFFDVGGLLDDEPSRRLSSTRTTDTDVESQAGLQNTWSNDFAGNNGLSPAPPRRGSTAFLQDVGGLLGPRTTTRNFSRTGGDYELQTIHQKRSTSEDTYPPTSPELRRHSPAQSLQDVGGLLK